MSNRTSSYPSPSTKKTFRFSSSKKNVSLPPTSGGGNEPPAPISCGAQVVSLTELSRGYDTLHLTYRQQVPAAIILACRAAKEALFSGHDVSGYVDIGCMRLSIARNGIKNYPYLLQSGDVQILLSARRPSTMPTAELHIGSISCQSGVRKVLDNIKEAFEQLGMRWENESVCRFDFAVDFNATMEQMLEAFEVSKFITYATKIFPHYTHGKLSGVQLGKGDIVLVLYNKVLEMTEKKDFEKQEYFKKKWGGDKKNVVRVEVRLRGSAIRQFLPKRRRFLDVHRNISRIWSYITREWCRYADKVDKKNKNQTKSKITESWKKVQSVFNYKDPSREVKRTIVHSKQLIAQAIGCLSSVVAATGLGIHSPGAVWRTIQDVLNEGLFPLLFDPAWQHKYESRRAKKTVCF